MGVDLYYGYYPKECNLPKILPYLKTFDGRWLNGHRMTEEFYTALNTLSTWNEEGWCWVFDDVNKIFESATVAPSEVCDYIVDPSYYLEPVQHEPNDIFIVWKR